MGPVGAIDSTGLDIVIVVGSQGSNTPGDDPDLRAYTHKIMDRIIASANGEPVHIVTSDEEAYRIAKDGDRLVYIGHSDANGLYTDDGTLDPEGFGNKRFREIDLIGCETLANQSKSKKWADLANGNLYGSYGKFAINWYANAPRFYHPVKYDPRRKETPWWGRLFPKGKKHAHGKP